MARVTVTLYALQFNMQAPKCPQQPRNDTTTMLEPSLADLIANLASERSSAHVRTEEEKNNDIGALAAHRVGEMALCGDEGRSYGSSDEAGVAGVALGLAPSQSVECSDGAVVGSVGSADVPSEGVERSDGAVVGSVGSADVPSESVECSDGAVVGSAQRTCRAQA